MNAIRSVHGRQVLDSRGRPTVEVEVTLSNGASGRASVPSGASTGSFEAHELRDGDEAHYQGLSVSLAVQHVRTEIADALHGKDASDQRACDDLLRRLDGTPELSRLGANAVLGASLAICRAAAAGQPLYQRIGELTGRRPTLPTPMVNILSGGLHAGGRMDLQDVLVVPVAATSVAQAIELVSRVRTAATEVCAERGLPTLLADEGGLSPDCRTGADALGLISDAIERAGLEPGADIAIALDIAATSLLDPISGRYRLRREGRDLTADQMIDMIEAWIREYPIISIEDPLGEEEWSGWSTLTSRVGHRVQVVGDDLYVTNRERLQRGIAESSANGVLVKVNQNGTLTGALDVILTACEAGVAPVVSARSGETEDDFLADLAVGAGAGQIKIGSLRSSERLAKYNQLLRIAEDPQIPFAQRPHPTGGPVS
ncbi:phosphopyruvate hydratase [Nocardia beijingensis]|uniref:phosphopyruvate hydratase n=1 Tax=Nocardia beijingensis TaxID=95162 RepID=UPI0033240DBC